jgi:hypothetical protein
MAKTYNPSSFQLELSQQHKDWVQSVHKNMNGNLDLGVPKGQQPQDASVNAGVFTQFTKGNGSGILIRIAANGLSGTGASYNWPGAGSLVINHGLGRQPIGFHVVDSDKDVRVFRAAAPTNMQITVQPTDKTASVTLYIF